jgi:hypothetical protein
VGGAGGGGPVADPCAVWTRATSGDAAPPANALQGGVETRQGVEFKQYICRVRVPSNADAFAVGKVIFEHQCYVTFRLGADLAQYTTASSEEIEVLTPPSSCTLDWQAAGTRSRPQVNLAPDGEIALYACRGLYSGADSSGTQVGSVLPQAMREGCFFEAWGQISEPQTPSAFDVLVRVAP